MSIALLCVSCGGPLDFPPGEGITRCKYCGSYNTLGKSGNIIYCEHLLGKNQFDEQSICQYVNNSMKKNLRIESLQLRYEPFWLCQIIGLCEYYLRKQLSFFNKDNYVDVCKDASVDRILWIYGRKYEHPPIALSNFDIFWSQEERYRSDRMLKSTVFNDCNFSNTEAEQQAIEKVKMLLINTYQKAVKVDLMVRNITERLVHIPLWFLVTSDGPSTNYFIVEGETGMFLPPNVGTLR